MTKRKKSAKQKNNNYHAEIWGVLLVAVGLVFAFAVYSDSKILLSNWLRAFAFGMTGVGGYLWPPLLIAFGILKVAKFNRPTRIKLTLYIVGSLILLSLMHVCGISDNSFKLDFGDFIKASWSADKVGGGFLGSIPSYLLMRFMGRVSSIVVLSTSLLICIMIITRFSIREASKKFGKAGKKIGTKLVKTHERVQEQKRVHKERQVEKQHSEPQPQNHTSKQTTENPAENTKVHVEEAYKRAFECDELFIENIGMPGVDALTLITEEEVDFGEDYETDTSISIVNLHTKKERQQQEREERERREAEEAARPRPYLVSSIDQEIINEEPPELLEDELEPDDVYEQPHIRTSRKLNVPSELTERHFDSESNEEDYEPYNLKTEQPFEIPKSTSQKFSVQLSKDYEEPKTFSVSSIKDGPDKILQNVKYKPQPMLEPRVENAQDFSPIPPEVSVEPEYKKPGMELLEPGTEPPTTNVREEIMTKADQLESTLKSFGISAKVINVCRGPVVTRYELQPAPGVKVSRITGLSDDIALALATQGIRIEAPIPGKAAIGVEVPNSEVSMVCARDIIDTDEFRAMKSTIGFALGKDISGNSVLADLAKMPHLLIAGATGSGKSVCVNTIIISMLFNATPDEVQMIMIDPKVVELHAYNDIPHLKIPVVTDPKKAAGALNWAVNEMISRYKMFAERGVKDLERFNASARKSGDETLPKLVIIIDELADLMMVSAKDVEDAVCRIAQLGRASGIHLIIATQRPSVDVITGLIKANVPSRIAFAVSSAVDSRTILDMGGAEKLLGRGDMLYYPTGSSKPLRVQGCYITDTEVEAVTDHLKSFSTPCYDNTINYEMEKAAANNGGKKSAEISEDEDDLIPRAIELALEYDQISISMLQRRLRVGYARAARLVDELEQRHIVSPAEGSKPRQILISWQEYQNMYGAPDDMEEGDS